jgi:hypothetical protein
LLPQERSIPEYGGCIEHSKSERRKTLSYWIQVVTLVSELCVGCDGGQKSIIITRCGKEFTASQYYKGKARKELRFWHEVHLQVDLILVDDVSVRRKCGVGQFYSLFCKIKQKWPINRLIKLSASVVNPQSHCIRHGAFVKLRGGT